MRVMIVSVTTGYGHHSTAAAIADSLRAAGAEAVVVDMYKYCGELVYHAMDKGYLTAVGPLRRVFGRSYQAMDHSRAARRLSTAVVGNRLLRDRFVNVFHGFQPDVVVTPHVYSAYVLNELKREGLVTAPVIGIITDYCIHPYWEDYDALEYIVTASELLTPAAQAKGIAEGRLLPFGLPVQPKFLTRLEKGEARALLGLEDRPTVLLMGGSMGYGHMENTLRELLAGLEEAQFVCVCGHNEQLAQALRDLADPRLRVLGFVNNVEQYMDAADCIVTKPGGLTVTELLVKGLPPVLTQPIPGHEEANALFLFSHGAALRTGRSLSAAQAVRLLLTEPERLEAMRQALTTLAHPDALDRLTAFILGLKSGSLPSPAESTV